MLRRHFLRVGNKRNRVAIATDYLMGFPPEGGIHARRHTPSTTN
jgi:hypothetical protein